MFFEAIKYDPSYLRENSPILFARMQEDKNAASKGPFGDKRSKYRSPIRFFIKYFFIILNAKNYNVTKLISRIKYHEKNKILKLKNNCFKVKKTKPTKKGKITVTHIKK